MSIPMVGGPPARHCPDQDELLAGMFAHVACIDGEIPPGGMRRRHFTSPALPAHLQARLA